MSEDEKLNEALHISSFVVRCLPDKLAGVMHSVAAMPGAEVHDSDPTGRFVALLDMESEKALVTAISAIEQLPGVINTSMAYHHIE